MQMIIKNIHWLLLTVLCLVFGVYGLLRLSISVVHVFKNGSEIKTQLVDKKSRLDILKNELETQKEEKVEGGKVIFQAEDMKFSAEASFAPLFEIFIDQAKAAGIKIRSIDYNYAPATDPIFTANMTGYNVCELTITAAGHYGDFQNFFKGITKESFLMSFPEMQLAPWENDRSILVNKFKLRLYTKTS